MKPILDWLRWEFDRRIEVTTAIRLITIERFLKAFVLIAGGVVLLVVSTKTDLHRFVQDMQTQLNLSPGRGWWGRLYSTALTHLGNLSRRQQDVVAVGAILYGLLEGFEGAGLLLRRRWAEYLVLIATAAFLPIEIEEIVRRATVLKVGALLINLAIIAYLVWRKRLFLERPGRMVADKTAPAPADLLRP